MSHISQTTMLPADDREVIVRALRQLKFDPYATIDTKERCKRLSELLDGADVDIHRLIEKGKK